MHRLVIPGEDRLDELAKSIWGQPNGPRSLSFEGNAQSFRIATKLESHRNPERNIGKEEGLLLTNASLCATVKYPWSYRPGYKKYSCYYEQHDRLEKVRAFYENQVDGDRMRRTARTLEAEIVDIADDITYAVHDAEDFFRAGLLPVEALKTPHSDFFQEICEEVAIDYHMQARSFASLYIDPALVVGTGSAEPFWKRFWRVEMDADLAEHSEAISRLRRWMCPPSVDYDSLLEDAKAAGQPDLRVLDAAYVSSAISSFNKAFPARSFENFDSEGDAIAASKYFSAELLGMLMDTVDLDDIAGVRLSIDARLTVLTLKYLERTKVYFTDPIRQPLSRGVEELEYVFRGLARYLGISCGGLSGDEAEQLEEVYLRRIIDRYDEEVAQRKNGASVEWLPVWPEPFAERLLSCLEADYKEVTERSTIDLQAEAEQELAEEDGTDAELPKSHLLRSRLMRGRLLIDAVSSLSEKEVGDYAEEIRRNSYSRP